MKTAIILLVLTGCDTWLADPNETTDVELSSDLSVQQVVAVHNAVLELNTAVGQELFHVTGEHFGRRRHVTVTTKDPKDDLDAETVRSRSWGQIRLGHEDRAHVVVHELLHCLLGNKHSDDKTDFFYPEVRRNAVLTDETLARIEARIRDNGQE